MDIGLAVAVEVRDDSAFALVAGHRVLGRCSECSVRVHAPHGNGGREAEILTMSLMPSPFRSP